MSNIAYTPLNTPKTVAKPGRVLICRHGECKLPLMLGVRLVNCIRAPWPSLGRWWRGAFVLIASLLLAACLPKEPEPDPNGSFGSSVTAMDHDPSDTFVRNVYVDGTWVGEGGRGGKTVAGGISLPNRWRPGLTAVVKWERCDRFDREHPVPDEQACRWTEKVVPIQKYDEVGHTDLHILEGGQVLIIPTMLDPQHPDYPGPGYPTKDFFRNTGKGPTE
ncbi:DUF3304 domain-containing protein [Lysobacter arvi]|uniref:DUF3304 domain-containing protein n=1 Tax=Lysobacter arvi TaxID=3038776 RepID=A0ABU1CEQ9_9GAMM|nr:DUF3304 domain-containing protein [Lysobacter arvi]MDR0183170.1 DUF3304 domain-containing protein [Lysobacter arvi]